MSSDSLEKARQAYAHGDHARALDLLAPLTVSDNASEAVLALAANAAVLSGSDQNAIDLLGRLRRLQPTKTAYARIIAQVHNRTGVKAKAREEMIAAEEAFQAALTHWPDYPDALFNLASLHSHHQRFASALTLLHRLRSLVPDDHAVAREIVLCLAKDEQAQAADSLLRELPPPDLTQAASCLLHAECLAWTGRVDEITPLLGRLRFDESQREPLTELAYLLSQLGFVEQASAVYDHVLALYADGRTSPGLQMLIQQHLLLPPVYRKLPHLEASRERFVNGLAKLSTALDAVAEDEGYQRGLAQLVNEVFLLAYQGRNDLVPMRERGQLLARIAPMFAPPAYRPAVHRATQPGQSDKRRIGLVSSHFRHCTAGHYFGGWITMLAAAGYDVQVFQLGPLFDDYTGQLGRSATRLHRLDGRIDEICLGIADARCDLLIYPELGMEARLLPLASLRLAPLQFCAWGHPVTSGLPTIDGYFSCAEMEPTDAVDHYSEKLLLLPGLGTNYPRPTLPEPVTRQSLGLPDQGNLYLLPHAPFKMHPDNDAVCAAIAASDPQAVLILFRGEHPAPVLALRRRLASALTAAGADPARQLRILPMVSRERFLQVNMVCDVLVDALLWSGGNTSIDALLCRLPIVTCPGRFMRARQSAAMLRRVGMDDLIVDQPGQLAEQAVAVATDPERREQLRRKIISALPTLFDANGVAEALNRHIEDAFRQPSSPAR